MYNNILETWHLSCVNKQMPIHFNFNWCPQDVWNNVTWKLPLTVNQQLLQTQNMEVYNAYSHTGQHNEPAAWKHPCTNLLRFELDVLMYTLQYFTLRTFSVHFLSSAVLYIDPSYFADFRFSCKLFLRKEK